MQIYRRVEVSEHAKGTNPNWVYHNSVGWLEAIELPNEEDLKKEAWNYGEKQEHQDKYFADCNFFNGAKHIIDMITKTK